jgi:hypothetical protein
MKGLVTEVSGWNVSAYSEGFEEGQEAVGGAVAAGVALSGWVRAIARSFWVMSACNGGGGDLLVAEP